MSHIPAHAMPHAKPKHDDDADTATQDRRAKPDRGGPGLGLIAGLVGGVAAIGTIGMAAAHLLRGRSAPKRERRRKKKG